MADSPTTVTFSSSAPTSSVIFTVAGTAAFSVTELRTTVLKPISATVTEYTPPGNEGTVKPPSVPLTTSTSAPVPLFLTLTLAPGMTRPDESTTVPDSDVKKLPCARASEPPAARVSAQTMRAVIVNLIKSPLSP